MMIYFNNFSNLVTLKTFTKTSILWFFSYQVFFAILILHTLQHVEL